MTHFVYSSLPSIGQLSEGRFVRVFPFEAKYKIEKYAREQLEHVTALIPGQVSEAGSNFHISFSDWCFPVADSTRI